MIASNTALIVVDVQRGLDDPELGHRNNPDAEKNIVRLLTVWRQIGLPIIHVQHLSTNPRSPLHPDSAGCTPKPEATPRNGERLVKKRVNCAFIGTDLESHLREAGIASIVVVGLTTNHCVSSTVRVAGDLGFNTFVVADATAAHEVTDFEGRHFSADDIHASALASLHREFGRVMTTDEVLGDLARLKVER